MFDAEKIMSEFTAIFMQAGGKILLSLVIFIVGRVIIDHIMKLVKKIHAIDRADKTVAGFIISGVKIVLNIVLLLSIINVLGVPMASVITILASAAMAIGLSLQGALSNIAGGIMLLIFRHFNVGEYIQANGMVKSYQITALRKYLNDAKSISQPELIKLLGNNVTGRNQSKNIVLTEKKLQKYFYSNYSQADMEKILFRLLDNWKAEQEK